MKGGAQVKSSIIRKGRGAEANRPINGVNTLS
jgi:hypothetical protein